MKTQIATTIEQSKKLAEILPLESADMYYEPSAGFRTEPSELKIGDIEYAHPRSIRCWSLAALLGVLPIVDLCTPTLKMKLNHKYYMELCIDCANYKYISTNDYDNPVDACYEMIIKLHELKML